MSLKESEKVELKKSTSELKEAIISMVSILNKHGNGEVYFGVKNNGNIVGQAITENTVREVSKAISDHIKPEIYPTIKAVKISGKDCLNICFSGKDAPYYAFGRVYLRSGDVDRQVSPSKIKEIILGKNKSLWETGRSDKTLNDISKKKLKDYIKKANEAERISFKYSDAKTTLNKLGLMKDGRLLKAAEVLFCKDGSPEVQAAIFAGTDKTTFLDIGQLRGNIFELLNKSREYISAHMNWRAELSGEGRKEIPEIPVRAIEEAVVNSLCHRDYSNPKGNEIAFFKDRIEIYNPGQFPEGVEPEDFIEGKERSELRNPLIANTLFLSKDIEKWGSGIRRIYSECKENKIRVEFKRLKTGFLVIFYRPALPVSQGGQKSGQKSGQKKSRALSERQKEIIRFIGKNPEISRTELAKKLKINPSAIQKHIEKLKNLGALERIGPDKGGHWKVK